MARKPVSSAVMLTIGIVMLAASIGMFVLLFGAYREQERAAAEYRQTEGTVVTAELRRQTRKGKADHWFVDRTYRYEVDGRAFESKRSSHTSTSYASREGAQRVVDANPPGSKITVWYDPADPSVAVLDRSPPSVVVLLVPFLVAAAGAFVLVLSRRRAAAAASGAVAG